MAADIRELYGIKIPIFNLDSDRDTVKLEEPTHGGATIDLTIVGPRGNVLMILDNLKRTIEAAIVKAEHSDAP